jgi:hypothetical protein
MDSRKSASDVVAARVRQVRVKRGMRTVDLAARCAELGAPKLTPQALYKLEGQRDPASRHPRSVTVDELLALAAALNVAAVDLLVPPDDPDEPYQVTSTVTERRATVRAWICGGGPLNDADPREYYAERPVSEFSVNVQAGVATARAVVPAPAVQAGPDAGHQESEDR